MKQQPHSSFQHTQISVYVTGVCAVVSLFYNSTQVYRSLLACFWSFCFLPSLCIASRAHMKCTAAQGILSKYELNRKWFSIYGVRPSC